MTVNLSASYPLLEIHTVSKWVQVQLFPLPVGRYDEEPSTKAIVHWNQAGKCLPEAAWWVCVQMGQGLTANHLFLFGSPLNIGR